TSHGLKTASTAATTPLTRSRPSRASRRSAAGAPISCSFRRPRCGGSTSTQSCARTSRGATRWRCGTSAPAPCSIFVSGRIARPLTRADDMPDCITGMHRSGTSMVAKLAHQSGLFLGANADLIPATPDNPDGHWEHAGFVKLNDAILNELGAGWDCPPPTSVDWKRLLSLPRLRRQADRLIEELGVREPWGWKDPRASLTLPFWLALCPDLRVLVCLRNPLELAVSLRQRGLSSYAFGLRLWSIYNWRLAERVDPDRRMVVHYASVL